MMMVPSGENPGEAAPEPSTSSTWSGSWIERWLNGEGTSSARKEGGQEATSQQPVEPAPVPANVPAHVPAPIQPVDDTGEPYNQQNSYWYTRRIIEDYLKADMDTNFPRKPSDSKYRRVFELVVGPNYKSKTKLVEVLADIANNPQNNGTIERARKIMDSIYQQRIKDRDLDDYQFEE